MAAIDGTYATGQLPLVGAVLCCTAIAPEQRAQLAAIGAQMGATIKLDLTSDVTHLIVGSTDSAKYRYVAKSRDDVKVLSPTWLEALRDVWMQGDDNVDVATLEASHRLPALFGLKICLTGFDNPEQRKHIQETVDMNGAEYHGDLTKSVTHLIAATPSGKKYEHALNWRMKIVSLEWFEQSLERGMVLDEALYNPTMPIHERGRGAWHRTRSTSPALGKRTRDADQSQALNPFRRKLRRSASTKMGTQSDALWAGITAASVERQQDDDDDDDWTEHSALKPNDSRAYTPVSLTEDTTAPDQALPSHMGRICVQPPLPPHDANSHHGLFRGRIVCPHGFDKEKTDILQQHLSSHGARVLGASELNNVSSEDLKRSYLVVPHDAEVDLSLVPDRAGSLVTLVSNWWVERCLHGKRLIDPTEDVLSRPFERLSVSGFSGLTVNSTGFAGIELLHVTKVVSLMGATYDEQLSGKISVMICNSSGTNSQKLRFAASKQIPIVTVTWLTDCIHSGRRQCYDNYRFGQAQSPVLNPRRRASVGVPTVQIPRDGAAEQQQERSFATKVVTNPLMAPQSRALDLAPSAESTPDFTVENLIRPAPNTNDSTLDQYEPSIFGLDGQASLPLQNISANFLQRPSTSSAELKTTSRQRSSSAESLIRAVPTARESLSRKRTPDSVAAAPVSVIPGDIERVALPRIAPNEPADEKDYSGILAQLRANRKAAPTPADQADEKRRKRRQLGRATSTRSNQSTGDSSGNIGLDDDDDENNALAEEYQPSQQLGWDSPGAAKAREQMIKKIGGTIQERSVPVQGIGIVEDAVSEGLGRASRKRRG